MQLIENNIYSFHGAHPTHVSSLVDMPLIPPKRFWYLYRSWSFTMSIIVVPIKRILQTTTCYGKRKDVRDRSH